MDMGWFIIILGLILMGIGGFFTYYGQSIIKQSSATTSVLSHILSPQAEKLLSLIYRHQKNLGLNKLIIGSKDGCLYFDEKEKRGKYTVNIIGELFDIRSDYSSRAKEFETLLLSIPSNLLRTIPETRVDSPYVVCVTEEGIKYLKKD